ncbi:endonuclease/exonuclease/phosphatase family domain-containing protein 1 isoform X2 [Orussus abietinus]|uniref:endonuclease/exonuclease/phosphatase family domain-containing protein 1 isoform X2 n=1 Tax=Orussus abietinus TaxID=222816 RepID=UPI000625F3A0|nr:endonuclease/exonuclease/phosphatase family domain-containing protein 1 isoform X2 [Orussus abietinus]
MGQSGSVYVEHGSWRHSIGRISFSSMGRRRSTTSKYLSHTFTCGSEPLKAMYQADQLNVNTATEEELMTLPGINRTIAANIVNHRRLIGRFNRVEDLALVSGVGARRLEQIRPEIYVPFSSGSRASSKVSLSLDSFGNSGTLVDVNTASVFALQAIPGINQELAARIVEKRTRRGPYRCLDELKKVRGMGKHRLAMIRPYLTVDIDSNGSITPTPSTATSSPPWNKPHASSTPIGNSIGRLSRNSYGKQNGTVKPFNAPRANGYRTSIDLTSGITEEDFWELLSVAISRPLTPCDFTDNLDGRTSIRLATWNLDSFSADKATNPGVREVICRTILENRLQEVESPEALDKLTGELNSPVLKRVRDWRGNQRVWKSLHLGAGLALLWDADPKLDISLREQPPETTVLLPVVASAVFHINRFDVTIINVRVHNVDDNKIIEGFSEAKNSILLGDFTLLDNSVFVNEVLHERNTAVESDKFFYRDNILWGKGSEELLNTGIAGIVRQGLKHLGIPQGWHWGGSASSHCPVWCQIFTQACES